MPYRDRSGCAGLRSRRQRGFTLVEAIAVIVLVGVIAAAVGLFLRVPIQSYFDLEQRAAITDANDTALRRIGRDLRLALPNSVRISGDGLSMEFLHTHAGGRYRVDVGPAGTEDFLNFSAPDSSFEVLGAPVALVAGDQIVIYNLGIPGADAYEATVAGVPHVRRAYNGATGSVSTINISTDARFPFDSPGHRFQVVDTPVTYRCAAGVLTRYANYPIMPVQPDPPAGAGAILAQDISACSFAYQAGVTERNGLVSMRMAMTKNNETVTLVHEVHVSNAP